MYSRKFSVDQIRKKIKSQIVQENRLFLSIVILVFAYIVSLSVEVISFGNFPLFDASPDRARIEFGLFGIHLFVGAMPLILLLIIEYFLFVKNYLVKKIILVLFFAIVFGSYFFLLVRFSYVVFICTSICVVYYTSKLLNIKNTTIVTIIFFFLFAYLLEFREAKYAEHFIYIISDLKFSETYAAFAGPYMYIAMNLENLANVIVKLDYFTFGYYTFDFLFALTGLKHWLANYYGLIERIYSTGGFNTYPFFYPYYRDFGLLGITIGTFLLGALINTVYIWMKYTASIHAIILYACLNFVLLISFFTNPLTMLNYIFMISMLLIIHWFVFRPSRI
jgi:oligosaccharide repeat unit polymerase